LEQRINDKIAEIKRQMDYSARLSLIETKLALCYQYFKEMNSHYEVDAVIKLQTAQLDLISALFVLVEDYLSFSYYLRKDKVQLTNKILEGKTVTWHEHEFLKDIDLNKAHEYLLLPIVGSFQELEEDEKEIVKDNLKEFAKDIHERIIRILKFFSSYNRVYNKYKHISPGLVGTYAILKNKETPHIFVRDCFWNKKTKVMEAAYVYYLIPMSPIIPVAPGVPFPSIVPYHVNSGPPMDSSIILDR
jgi:hypothetical protein